jgi:hypothetical protein
VRLLGAIGCQFRGLFDFEGVARRTTESKKSKHREALAEREGFEPSIRL